MNQKVFVTGHMGTAGSMVTQILSEHGVPWVGYDLQSGDDLMDKANILEKLDGCTHVFHLAAIPDAPVRHVDLYEGDKWPIFAKANLAACIKVFDAADECGVEEVTMASSLGIFGEPIRLFKIPADRRGPYNIDSLNQIEPYSLFKISAQRMLGSYSFKSTMLLLGSVNMHRPNVGHCPVGECIKIWPEDAAYAFYLTLRYPPQRNPHIRVVTRPQPNEIVRKAIQYLKLVVPRDIPPSVFDISEEIDGFQFWKYKDDKMRN